MQPEPVIHGLISRIQPLRPVHGDAVDDRDGMDVLLRRGLPRSSCARASAKDADSFICRPTQEAPPMAANTSVSLVTSSISP